MAIGAFASSHSQPEPVIKAASLSGQSFKARNLVQHIFGEERSLIVTLRGPLEVLAQSIQDLQRLVQADLRAQCQNLATSSTLLDRQLKRLVKRWGNSELRAKYQEEFQGY
ncbi:MAG: hypothetical protein KDD62_03575, partial [Bdellovibrionales bacterium]|nr:hypothetical protein [Bdellovibrionales bacterium]